MHILTNSPHETRVLGRQISRHAAAGDIICLCGDLGSGKTILTQGICAGMGIEPREVTSPTFVLLHQYAGRIPVYHFDLYRLDGPRELAGIGYEEYFFDDGVSVIEWADKLGCLTPPERLQVELRRKGQHARSITLRAYGSRYAGLLEKIDEDRRHRHLK